MSNKMNHFYILTSLLRNFLFYVMIGKVEHKSDKNKMNNKTKNQEKMYRK